MPFIKDILLRASKIPGFTLEWMLRAGACHNLAIDKNGRAWAWGSNALGQLGDNSTSQRNTPVSVLGAVKTFCKISGGGTHTAAIDKNGRAWAWGFNSEGQLGDNTIVSKRTPVSVAGAVKTFCKISAGGTRTIGIDKNGRVWGWGFNSSGQLGDNSVNTRWTPVSVAGAAKTFCRVVAAGAHTIAIDKNGRAWGWGLNDTGQIGDNSITQRNTPVSVLGVVKTFCEITGGMRTTNVIDKNGRVWGWGNNGNGQLGDNTIVSKQTPVSVLGAVKTFCKISAGLANTIAIDKNGQVWGWGRNGEGQIGNFSTDDVRTPTSIGGLQKTFCDIFCGDYFTVAVDNNNTGWAWGHNLNGVIGNNSQVSTCHLTPISIDGQSRTFCMVGCGSLHTAAIDVNGILFCWGGGTLGRLGNNSLVPRYLPSLIQKSTISFNKVSAWEHTVSLDNNGRAWGWGTNGNGRLGDNSTTQRNTPVSVAGAVKTFCHISAGGAHTIAIDKNGRAWGWGSNGSGRLGDNTTVSKQTPVSVLGAVKTFCNISTGDAFTMAIDKNGRAWGWGFNGNGQLGDNTIVSKQTPVSVLGAVKTFCKISSGGLFSVAIDKNGRVWGWGNNGNGQLGDNTIVSKRTPVSVAGAVKTFCQISAGRSYTMAIDKNGRAWGWGLNGQYQLGDGTATSRITPVSVAGAVKTFCQIFSGNVHTMAIDKDGKLWGWGGDVNVPIGHHKTSTPVRICNI